jgi:hypothetical protein
LSLGATSLNKNTVPNAVWAYSGKPSGGGSNPRFYHFDDHVVILVKWHPSAHGLKACYNELTASRLAQLLGAPVLRGAAVYVPDDVIPADHRAIGACEGFHFGVAKMNGCDFVAQQHYGQISNSGELPTAAVHLAWLRIADQDGHNQWLEEAVDANQQSIKMFKLVDMGFMFTSPNWTAATLAVLAMSYSLPAHIADRVKMAELQPAIAKLKALPKADIEACFNDVPDEWTVSTQDRQAAVAQALLAQDKIEEILRNGNPKLS